MGTGLWMLWYVPNTATNHAHFGGSNFALSHLFDPTSIGLNKATTVYAGFLAVLANLVVAIIVTLICKAASAPDGVDITRPDDYTADAGDAAPPAPPQQLAGDELPEPVPTA